MWPAYVLLLWLLQSANGVAAMLKVEINNEVLKVRNDSEVDFRGEYHFVPHERVDITCLGESVDQLSMLSVVCPQYNYSSVPESVKSINFNMILEPHHNDTYVDCILDVSLDYKQVLRVYMFLEQNYDEHELLRVNGEAVRQGFIVSYKYYGISLQLACGTNAETGCKHIIRRLIQVIPQNLVLFDGLWDDRILFEIYTNTHSERMIVYGYNDNDTIELRYNPWMPCFFRIKSNQININDLFAKEGRPKAPIFFKYRFDHKIEEFGLILSNIPNFNTNITNISLMYQGRSKIQGDITHEGIENTNNQQRDKNIIIAACVGVLVGVLVMVFAFYIKSRCEKKPVQPRPPLALPIHTEQEQQHEYAYVYSHRPRRQLKKPADKRTVTAQ